MIYIYQEYDILQTCKYLLVVSYKQEIILSSSACTKKLLEILIFNCTNI